MQIAAFILILFSSSATFAVTSTIPSISRIAFGSCSNQSAPQPIWDAIVNYDPQLFIWLGDNIYGDNKRAIRVFGKERTVGPWKNSNLFFPSTFEEMVRRYRLAKANPGYVKLRGTAQVIGTWDDHDYGLNDAGKEFAGKDQNQKLLLDFLDEPEDSPRRQQAGVYTSYLFGPKGKRVKVILLDTRYHRDPLFSDGTILGKSQWAWLESELKGPESEITIIASSIQVVSNLSATVGPFLRMESWGGFPSERERLYKLIDDSKRNGVFFISGDVHFGEISRDDCSVQYPLYDVTSSGITQAIEERLPPLLAFAVKTVAHWTPTTMRILGANCRYRSCTFGKPNFGVIEIEWDATPPKIKLQVRDADGYPVTAVAVSLSELQPRNISVISREEEYQRHCSLEKSLPWYRRYFVASILIVTMAVLVLAFALLGYATVLFAKKVLLKSKID